MIVPFLIKSDLIVFLLLLFQIMAIHTVHNDFVSTPAFEKEFILSVLTGVVLTSFLLVLPAVKHFKTVRMYFLDLDLTVLTK